MNQAELFELKRKYRLLIGTFTGHCYDLRDFEV